MTYAEKLKDPRWQKKRLEILERDKWTCQNCGQDKRMLHVHHLAYNHNKPPWETSDLDLITLCDECHALGATPMSEHVEVLMYAVYYRNYSWDELHTVLCMALEQDEEIKLRAQPAVT